MTADQTVGQNSRSDPVQGAAAIVPDGRFVAVKEYRVGSTIVWDTTQRFTYPLKACPGLLFTISPGVIVGQSQARLLPVEAETIDNKHVYITYPTGGGGGCRGGRCPPR
eukprot:8504921-Pyramimonas_sp.AAC.2